MDDDTAARIATLAAEIMERAHELGSLSDIDDDPEVTLPDASARLVAEIQDAVTVLADVQPVAA